MAASGSAHVRRLRLEWRRPARTRTVPGHDSLASLHLLGFPGDFIATLKAYFNVKPEDSLEDLERSLSRKKEGAFGLIVQGTPGFALLSYKKQGVPGMADAPALLARLDVTILHSVVLERILGITKEEQEKKIHLNYEQAHN